MPRFRPGEILEVKQVVMLYTSDDYMNHDYLIELKESEIVTYLGKSSRGYAWALVRGQTGWISEAYLRVLGSV